MNSPVNFNDPTGHESVCGSANSDPECKEIKKKNNPKNNPTIPISNPEKNDIPRDPLKELEDQIAECSKFPFLSGCNNLPTPPNYPYPPEKSHAPSTAFEEFVNYFQFSFEVNEFIHTMELAENYGRPIYKHVKYSVSLLGFEYGIDGALQLYDDRNKNLAIPQRLARGGIRAVESFVIDGGSQFVGGASAIGTGSPLGYFAGAYLSSGLMDNLATNNINPYIFNNRYLGGP